jgi:hypothetical protein
MMQYGAFFKISEWKVYFHHSVAQHTGYPAAKGVQFYLVLLAVIKKE